MPGTLISMRFGWEGQKNNCQTKRKNYFFEKLNLTNQKLPTKKISAHHNFYNNSKSGCTKNNFQCDNRQKIKWIPIFIYTSIVTIRIEAERKLFAMHSDAAHLCIGNQATKNLYY